MSCECENAPGDEGRQSSESAPASAEPDYSPIDYHALDLIRSLESDGKPGILARVISNYRTGSAQLLKDLRQAAASSDLEKIRTAAHTLKSSSANVGALELAALCKELESKAPKIADKAAWESLRDIEAEHERVLKMLAHELGKSTYE